MRFLKGLIYFTAVVFAISCVLSGIYLFRPDITNKVEAFLYSEPQSVEMKTEGHDLQEETASHPDESTKWEETRQKTEGSETDVAEPSKDDVIAESAVSDHVLPEQSQIVVPENVLGRNGYQQIQENSEQIDDEAAERLQDQLDPGYTGDGLEFDGVWYPYYAMLDDRGKHSYRQIYANARERYAKFAPVEQVTSAQKNCGTGGF